MPETRTVPRTKLWGDDEQGYVIVLECVCGAGVDYPGHPDDRERVTCDDCGRVYVAASDPSDVPAVVS